MIRSMTGYGVAEHVEDGVSYTLEIRSVNNRFLKLLIKLPDSLQFAERALDSLLRSRMARGSVMCAVRVRSEGEAAAGTINVPALQHYVDQVSLARLPERIQATLDLGTMALLPGVCEAPDVDEQDREHQLEIIQRLASRASDAVIEMRRSEGEALRSDVLGCCGAIRKHLSVVTERAHLVVGEYHERLRARVETLMQAGGFELEAEGLMREVAIFAERCDINEELTRLNAHLDQFAELCDRSEPVGRTLDFLTQELLREANTVASKSNDAAISRCVVEVKGLIDRLKEQVQNVE